MPNYWFKPKKFGWGITPISKEGWLLTLLISLLLFADGYAIYNTYPQPFATIKFIIDTFIITFVFLLSVKRKIKGDIGL